MQTIVRRLHEEPAPPSARTEMAIPPELDALVLACLARRASDRPQAADLGQILRAIDIDEPWTQEKAARWWSLNRPAQPIEPGDPTRTGS
jgi:serine/threonine-protein kinase